ncbi:hypothetical protein SADUNF_Sadunf09G0006200 [Salix dunnii]|uniref:POX domain-containing protein n=1 Tax=Salix dunnii TaxID=1413687 RepID=A0A835MZE0_9ROSI|nr:hypothetical protein SADUNF_Sadunf09G0006200 [Salix dunnii]
METRSFRPESHVAQQSRREKLRDQQSLTSDQHFDDCPNSFEGVSLHPGLSPDLVHVQNIRNDNTIYDFTMFPSEMLKFATSSHILSALKVSIVDQKLGAVPLIRSILVEESLFTAMSHPVLSNFNVSPKASSCDPQGCCNWISLDSHQSYDLMANYAGGSVIGERNQKPMFAGEVLLNNARISNISTSRQYLMPCYIGNQNLQLPSIVRNTFGEISSEDHIKQLKVMQLPSPPPYQNALQDVIPSGCFRSRMNERLLHPSYGLSLSLSSIDPPSKLEVTHLGEEYASEHLQLKLVDRVSQESHQHSEFSKPSSPCAMPKPSIINKSLGESSHDIVGTSTHAIGNTGPHGPFTGYATILKSSKFLKLAQQLLE